MMIYIILLFSSLFFSKYSCITRCRAGSSFFASAPPVAISSSSIIFSRSMVNVYMGVGTETDGRWGFFLNNFNSFRYKSVLPAP